MRKGQRASAATREKCSRAAKARQISGAKNPNWKGGRARRVGGRIAIYSPGHPHAELVGSTPYVFEYRLVAERKLGRYLRADEVVHHIDGNPHNNHPDNLQVMSQVEHARLHADEMRDPASGRLTGKRP